MNTQPRSIKELLQLMLENKEIFLDGLCSWSFNLYFYDKITSKEDDRLSAYIRMNRPDNCKHDYWWTPCEIQPRIDWINEHIKLQP